MKRIHLSWQDNFNESFLDCQQNVHLLFFKIKSDKVKLCKFRWYFEVFQTVTDYFDKWNYCQWFKWTTVTPLSSRQSNHGNRPRADQFEIYSFQDWSVEVPDCGEDREGLVLKNTSSFIWWMKMSFILSFSEKPGGRWSEPFWVVPFKPIILGLSLSTKIGWPIPSPHDMVSIKWVWNWVF